MALRVPENFDNLNLAALSSKAASVVTVLLILTLAWSAAQLTWSFLEPAQTIAHVANTKPSAPHSPVDDRKPALAAKIVSAHLFGKATDKAPVPQVVDAPETRLNLKLRGVYATADENKGYALIASGSGKEKLYATGQAVPGNAVLKAVFPDRVILDRKGRFETLRMANTKTTGSSSYRPRNSASNTRQLSSDSRVVKLRQEILRNPRKLAELVSAQPAYENGVFAGYRITTRRSDPVFDELNLKSGDIITAVNGIPIDSPQSGLQALQQLARASSASVSIKRGEELIELNLSL